MKVNLKIDIKSIQDGIEAQNLLFSLDYKWAYADRPEIFSGFTVGQMNTCKINKILTQGESDRILIEITLPELRELARPKEYLNDKFEFVVTNQPEDGFILVPDGAEYATTHLDSDMYPVLFWKYSCGSWQCFNAFKEWNNSIFSMNEYMNNSSQKILWQRENKVETVKGRFLHQEWYEAFGRGEDVQIGGAHAFEYFDLNFQHSLSDFNNPAYRFRLKPQTIQIGSRTINKPISVKPERDTVFYIPDLGMVSKYARLIWMDSDYYNYLLTNNLCHLTPDEAINHADALLELMK